MGEHTHRVAASVSHDGWSGVCEALRSTDRPHAHAAFATLWTLALPTGRRALRRYRALDASRIEDLVRDVLVARLSEIVRAASPRAYFVSAVHNTARSWLRSPRAEVVEPDAREGYVNNALDDEEALRVFVIDGRARFAAQSSRAQRLMAADAMGWTREEIAAHEGTSRANVDQILSRARRGL